MQLTFRILAVLSLLAINTYLVADENDARDDKNVAKLARAWD